MKIRPEALVETWALRPDAFALEPEHIRAQFASQVEARMKELEAGDALPERETEELPALEEAVSGEEAGQEVWDEDPEEEDAPEAQVETRVEPEED